MSLSKMERRLRTAGLLVVSGLSIEAASLAWTHPLSFLVFAGFGGLLIGGGLLVCLGTLFQSGPAS
jgi:hypothetical protein